MLRVGLTGGIGSGKSTVAQRFRELGALVVDADQLAREVVEPGSTGLAAIRQRFGEGVLTAEGSLDRDALGAIVFADPRARRDLEAITHPLIGARTRSLVESASPDRIVVHDVPLLVELDLTAAYHLTVVVGADEDVRVERLTKGRGLTTAGAWSRIAAQASDHARRAAADAWLDNNGTVDALLAQVDALWQDRIVGFNDNLTRASASRRPDAPALVPYDESWPLAAARLIRRISRALGEGSEAIEHIGSTSIPGLMSEDVIDLQVGVRTLADADDAGFVHALAEAGFPRSEGERPTFGWASRDEVTRSPERLHAGADPGRIVRVQVRETAGPAWRAALLFRDWLRAEAGEREAFGELECRRFAAGAGDATTTADDVEAASAWLEMAFERADAWAGRTRWSGR